MKLHGIYCDLNMLAEILGRLFGTCAVRIRCVGTGLGRGRHHVEDVLAGVYVVETRYINTQNGRYSARCACVAV